MVDLFGEMVGYENPHLSADLVLVAHKHGDHNNVALVEGEPIVVRGLDESGNVQAVDRHAHVGLPAGSMGGCSTRERCAVFRFRADR